MFKVKTGMLQSLYSPKFGTLHSRIAKTGQFRKNRKGKRTVEVEDTFLR